MGDIIEPWAEKTLFLLMSRSEESVEQLRVLLEESIRQRNGGKLTKSVPKVHSTGIKIESNEESSEEVEKDDLQLLKEELSCVECREMTLGANNRLVECASCGSLYHQECHSPPIPSSNLLDPKGLFVCSKCHKPESAREVRTEESPETLDPKIPVLDLTTKDQSDDDDDDVLFVDCQVGVKSPSKTSKIPVSKFKKSSEVKKKKMSSPSSVSRKDKTQSKSENLKSKGSSESNTKVTQVKPKETNSSKKSIKNSPVKSSKPKKNSAEKVKTNGPSDSKSNEIHKKKYDSTEVKQFKEKLAKEVTDKKEKLAKEVTDKKEKLAKEVTDKKELLKGHFGFECKTTNSKVQCSPETITSSPVTSTKISTALKSATAVLKKSAFSASSIASRRVDVRPIRPLDLMERPPKVVKVSPKKDLKKIIIEKLRQKLKK